VVTGEGGGQNVARTAWTVPCCSNVLGNHQPLWVVIRLVGTRDHVPQTGLPPFPDLDGSALRKNWLHRTHSTHTVHTAQRSACYLWSIKDSYAGRWTNHPDTVHSSQPAGGPEYTST